MNFWSDCVVLFMIPVSCLKVGRYLIIAAVSKLSAELMVHIVAVSGPWFRDLFYISKYISYYIYKSICGIYR